jgi:WD40 repeat protein
VPRDLETIVHKAIEREPGRRYQSAAELAADLQRFVAGEPIQARRVGTLRRAALWAKRRPTAAALLLVSGVAALALVGVAVALLYSAELGRERDRTAEALQRANFYQYFHHIALAHSGWQDGNLIQLERLLEDCPGDRRNWEWHYLKRLSQTELLTLQATPGIWTRSVAFHPDGTRLATAHQDGFVRFWDAVTGQLLDTLPGHTAEVRAVAYSLDGSRLASGSQDCTVTIWDTTTGKPLHTLEGHKGWVNGVAFSPDGRRLASASWDKTVRVWDVTTGRRIPDRNGREEWNGLQPGPVNHVTFSPDGSRLALVTYGDTGGDVHVWDAHTGAAVRTLPGGLLWSGGSNGMTYSPDGTRLVATGARDRTVKMWDAVTGKELPPLKGHTAGINSVAFSPDGARLASASDDATIRVWDAKTGQEVATFKGHTKGTACVAFSPDGAWLASASFDGTVKVWAAITVQESHTLRGHAGMVSSIAFHPDGSRLASAGQDRNLKIWDLRTNQEIRRFPVQTAVVRCVAFSPEGNLLASAGMDGLVPIWELATGKSLVTLPGHPGGATCVAFGPDGSRLATAGWRGGVSIWHRSGLLDFHLPGHTAEVLGLAFSPDGKWLASAAAELTRGTLGEVKVWDLNTCQAVCTLRGHIRPVAGLAFARNGSWLATGSRDGTVKVWDWAAAREVLSLKSSSGMISGVAFSPDSLRLAAAHNSGTVTVWEMTTGLQVLHFKGDSPLESVAFSPDGTRLAASDDNGLVKLWDGRPVTPETRLEHEARGLVEYLFARPLCKDDVRDYLANARTISPAARQRARDLVKGYREETAPESYFQASWALLRQPYLNPVQYRFALRQAQTACQRDPQNARYQAALAVAQYRAGQHQDARTTLARLRQTMQTPAWAGDAEAQGCLREATALIAGAAPDRKP